MNLLILAIIFLVSSLFLGFDIWSYPLISPDEPRYAETAREMMESGQYIVPYCDYVPRFDKPILFYWFELISFKIFGLTEFAARLPSVFAGAGLVCLAFLLGSIQSYGLVAAAIMLTSLKVFVLAKLAITDMVLAFFISAAISFFYLGYRERLEMKQKFALREKRGSPWFIFSFIMMGLGMLSKGPVAVVLPLLVILAFLIYEKELVAFISDAWLDLVIGMVLFLVITLPWYIAVHIMTAGEFTKEFFLSHNFSRFTEVHTGHAAPFWFYIPVVLAGFFPWSFFLFQAATYKDLSAGLNSRSDAAKAIHQVRFCLLWAVIVFAFFSFSKTKLPTYIAPVYLPLVMVMARWWSVKFKARRGNGYKNVDALIGLGLMVFVILIVDILVAFVFKGALVKALSSAVFLPIAIFSFLFISAAVIAMTAILTQARFSFVALLIAASVSYLVLAHFAIRPFAIARDSGSKAFMQSLPIEARLVGYGLHRTRFEFYGQRQIPQLNYVALFKYLNEGPGYFVTHHRYLRRFNKYSNKRKTMEGPLYTRHPVSSDLYFIGESTVTLEN